MRLPGVRSPRTRNEEVDGMITVPEGMSLEEFALQGDQAVIERVRSRKGKGRRFVVPKGLIKEKHKEDRTWPYRVAREGEPPARMRVAEVEMEEKEASQDFVQIAPADSISIPGWDETVKVNPDGSITPQLGPDFSPVRGKVLIPTPEPIMARGNVVTLPNVDVFQAKTRTENIPGFGMRRWNKFPKRAEMQAPDKLIYDNPSSDAPDYYEREIVHEEYAQEGREAAEESFPEEADSADEFIPMLGMGSVRIADDVPLEQFDVIATAAAAIITAGATGYQAYSQIKAAKEAKKEAEKAAAASAVQQAAAFEQQFNQMTAARYGAPPPGGAPVNYPPTFAPYAQDTGTDWGKIAIFGIAGLAVVGVGYLLLK